MSKTRIFLRIFLVAMIIGLVVVGYFVWAKSRPNYYYDRAQAAVEREQYEAARLDLAKLLERNPDHADGYELLSQVILLEARANGNPANYAAQPAAAVALARASELRPDSEELQRRLVRAYLQMRYYSRAATVAERLYERDKKDGDAHFAVTWRAVKFGDHERAEQLFAETEGVVSQHVFQELALKLMHYTDINDEYKRNATFVEAMQTADRFSAEELQLISRRDREVMIQVLLMCQAHSSDAQTSLEISRLIVNLGEQLANENLLSTERVGKYTAQSQAMLNAGLRDKALDERQRWLRDQLADRAGDLGEKAVASGRGASPAAVYWTTARKLLSDGKPNEALAKLEKGIDDWRQVRLAEAQQTGARPSAADLESADDADIVLNEQQLQLHLWAARLLIMQQRYSEAEDHLDKLAGHNKYAGWGHLQRGDFLLNKGRLPEARDELLAAEAALGKHIQLSMSLARAYMGLKEWQNAIPHLESLLQPDDRLSEDERVWRTTLIGFADHVHLDLLRARLELGQWEEAQDNLRALKESELAAQAWNIAIAFLWERRDVEKTRKYLALARDKFSDDIDLVFLEANILRDQGQISSAEALFEDFAAANRNDPVRKLAQARWLVRDGKSDKALRVLGTLERHPLLTEKARNTLKVLRVQALIETQQFEEADADAIDLIANPSTAPAGYLLKSIMAWQSGDEELGAQLLAKARAADPKQQGHDMELMQARTPAGEIVGVVVYNVYYW